MMDHFADRIEQINKEHGLEISLAHIEEIYGSDALEQLAQMADEVEGNIEYLLSLGFAEDVSDICNRFGIILGEDTGIFAAGVDRLIASIGPDYVEKMGQDMSCWETLL